MKALDIAHINGKKKVYELRGFSNILGLENPNELECSIMEYKSGLSVLQIRLYESLAYSEKFFTLEITNLFYLSCPNQWKGANFRLANELEAIKFLRRFPQYKQIPDEILKDLTLLMVLEDVPFDVMICATNFAIFLDDYHPKFKTFEIDS